MIEERILEILENDKYDNFEQDILDLLSQDSLNINYKTSNGQTFLMKAIEIGSIKIVAKLLELNPKLEEKDEDGWTAFTYAVEFAVSEIVDMLFQAGADLNVKDKQGWQPEYYDGFVNNHEYQFDRTPLIRAIENDDVAMVINLLSKGVNIESHDNYGWTALVYAIEYQRYEILQILIAAGAKTEFEFTAYTTVCDESYTVDDYSTTPLKFAKNIFVNGSVDEVLVSILTDAVVYNANLFIAIDKNHLSALKFIIKHAKTNINNFRINNIHPMIYAIEQENFDALKLLAENGADVNAADLNESTVLMEIAQIGSVDIADFLIKNGANLNMVDKNGDTALTIAAEFGNFEVLKLLLHNGADINASSMNRKAVLEQVLLKINTAQDGNVNNSNIVVDNENEIKVAKDVETDMVASLPIVSLSIGATNTHNIMQASDYNKLTLTAKLLFPQVTFEYSSPSSLKRIMQEESKEYSKNILAFSHKITYIFKVLDSSLDVFRLVQEPSLENLHKLANDAALFGVMWTGTESYLPLVSGVNIASSIYNGEYYKASGYAISYTLLQNMMGDSFATLYGLGVLSLSIYQVVFNAFDLYSNYGTAESRLKSDLSYASIYNYLGFKDKARELFVDANNIMLEDFEQNHDYGSSIFKIAKEYDFQVNFCQWLGDSAYVDNVSL